MQLRSSPCPLFKVCGSMLFKPHESVCILHSRQGRLGDRCRCLCWQSSKKLSHWSTSTWQIEQTVPSAKSCWLTALTLCRSRSGVSKPLPVPTDDTLRRTGKPILVHRASISKMYGIKHLSTSKCTLLKLEPTHAGTVQLLDCWTISRAYAQHL